MLGPILLGTAGVSLRPPTLADAQLMQRMQTLPETTRYWGPRYGEYTEAHVEERFKRLVSGENSINWSIQLDGDPVGFTGIFNIDWIRRDAETGIFIGRPDLYGRGVATEAIRTTRREALASGRAGIIGRTPGREGRVCAPGPSDSRRGSRLGRRRGDRERRRPVDSRRKPGRRRGESPDGRWPRRSRCRTGSGRAR